MMTALVRMIKNLVVIAAPIRVCFPAVFVYKAECSAKSCVHVTMLPTLQGGSASSWWHKQGSL